MISIGAASGIIAATSNHVAAILLLSLSVSIFVSLGVVVVAQRMSDRAQDEYEESRWTPGQEPESANDQDSRP